MILHVDALVVSGRDVTSRAAGPLPDPTFGTPSAVGSALFRTAEAAAITAGATSIDVDASLAAVEFYTANGFEEVGRGEHRLWSGRSMACVFMHKDLTATGPGRTGIYR